MATAEANIQNKIRKGKKTSEEDLEDYVEIVDENADAKRETSKVEQIKLSSEEDLESLLKLAEDLKEKVDKKESNYFYFIIVWRSYQILCILFTIIIYLFFNTQHLLFFNTQPAVIFAIFVIPFILFAEYRIKINKGKSLPDKLALKEVLQLLREVHGTIAEREDWSILKRAEFRIRLSRFDLSEKKDSVFSFFS